MGTFNPSNSLLTSVYEGTEVSFTITYTDGETPYPVTITPSATNEGVIISNGTISGFYRQPFDNYVTYKKGVDSSTVNRLRQVPKKDRGSIYRFDADPVEDITFTYTAFANNESKEYSIIVVNRLEDNRNRLMNFVGSGAYKELVPKWTNNKGKTVKWVNRWKEVTDWTENIWPWL